MTSARKRALALGALLGFKEQIEPSSNLTPDEQIEPGSNLTGGRKRGRNKATLALIEAMRKIAEESKPITGRGIGYKLFTAGLISGMHEMPKVYRALVAAREDGTIPWPWIIDETRELELISTWDNPRKCANGFFYRRDLWQTQMQRVEVWSEKGTVRGVLWPVLSRLGVGFRVMHGFSSATSIWDAANNGNDDRPLVALYIGDWDPSGMCMSEVDLPRRIAEYGGHHIEFRRIALSGSKPSPPCSARRQQLYFATHQFRPSRRNPCRRLTARSATP
jgi:hypothetical protein